MSFTGSSYELGVAEGTVGVWYGTGEGDLEEFVGDTTDISGLKLRWDTGGMARGEGTGLCTARGDGGPTNVEHSLHTFLDSLCSENGTTGGGTLLFGVVELDLIVM